MRRILSLLRLPKPSSRRQPGPHGPKPRELLTDSDWVRLRAPERHRDQTLSPGALEWLERLPDGFCPETLAERFPRIVNRFAMLWPDPGLTENYLDELLMPKRPDRQGFPAEVTFELQSLQFLNEHRLYLADDPAGGDEPQEPGL